MTSLCAICLVGLLFAQSLRGPVGLIAEDPVLDLASGRIAVAGEGDFPASASDPAAIGGVSAAWAAETSTQTGISLVAVAAYGGASLKAAQESPTCKLGWTTLAGIGAVETGHGTFQGAHLLSNGRTSRPILGPALDGREGFAAIRSTAESVVWHDDRVWDHAIGPLQFIPSTWEKWQADGDGDGAYDPHNVFDATYAAAHYLCAAGTDMTTAAGWTRAVHSYNHSDAYVEDVLRRANTYATLTPP
ncbi:MAG: lytic murein transglycosylase [Nocardioidaceae bacterium]|nr:lytic murein transglycosylase [Nocardioidaceae bacterium]